MANVNHIKARELDVEIVDLAPMRVAVFRSGGEQPEGDAIAMLETWKRAHKSHVGSRRFGFNDPTLSENDHAYGYELWEQLADDETVEDVAVKEFPGGTYAVSTVVVEDDPMHIMMGWEELDHWVSQSHYEKGDHQWLEEHRLADDNKFVLDLYYPIIA